MYSIFLLGVQELVSTLCSYVTYPVRSPDGPFVFAVDHCFSIRGKGTVMTGTTLYGSISANDVSYFCAPLISSQLRSTYFIVIGSV